MSRAESFGETHDVEITVLVENNADLLVKSTDTVKRFTEKPLLAEHGFAALVELKEAGVRILWDAGISTTALLENARLMKIDLAAVDLIALSHGHGDHYAAMSGVLRADRPAPRAQGMAARCFNGRDPRVGDRAQGTADRPPCRFPRALGHRQGWKEIWPSRSRRGTSGSRPGQRSSPRRGPIDWARAVGPRARCPVAATRRRARRRPGPTGREISSCAIWLDDDQSIAINVRDKGLVVLSGCAHSGIVNTVQYAREISGVDEVYAILGGFHLAPAKDDEIERTIDEIIKLRPKMVVPTHCTGFKAITRFSSRMPDEFVQGVVGTRYLF